jgi:uncharacterized protein HemX
MIGRLTLIAVAAAAIGIQPWRAMRAQDVPGIEICTVEKNMERRTSCLQSNIDFLQKTLTKSSADYHQRLDAANRQIEALKATIVSLQKSLDDLQAAQKKLAEDPTKKTDTVARDASVRATEKPPEKATGGAK